MPPLDELWYILKNLIVDHPSGYGFPLLWGLAALSALLVLKIVLRKLFALSDSAARALVRFFELRAKGDLEGMAALCAGMKFDAKGRVDDWFTRLSVGRLAGFQRGVEFVKYLGRELRLGPDGRPLGGMLSMRIRARSARGEYEAMVFVGARPVAPFDGGWKVLVQDFTERVGTYEGPTAVYAYKKPKLSPVGEELAKAWKAHAKRLSITTPFSPKDMPPEPGPLQEPKPKPFYGQGPRKK
jgi:hypothetical protein